MRYAMRLVWRLAAVLGVAAALVSAATAGTKPKTTITPAGTAAAQRALLPARDLGAGWTEGAKALKTESLGCGTGTKLPVGVVEIGTADSATFEQSGSGPFISQAVFVYQTPAEAFVLWQGVAGPAVLSCLAQSALSGGGQGVGLEVLQRQRLWRPAPGTRSSAYRIVVQVQTTAQKVRAYIDVVLLGRGAAVTSLSFAGFSEPMAASLELATARAAASRL
jgi:hypothetical protein